MTTTSASRHWPEPGAGASDYAQAGHKHRQPRLILSILLAAIVGLLIAVSLLAVYAFRVEERLLTLEEYVAGRGEFRDREADRLEDDIDRAVCAVLGELGPVEELDPVRVRYGCPIPDRPEES